MAYYLWLKNNENYYERIYKTTMDILSSIGGVSNAIIFIVHIINKVINQYTALKDIKSILTSSNLNIDEIDKPKKIIQFKNNSSINLRNIGDSSTKKNLEKANMSSRTNIEIINKNIALDKEVKKEKKKTNSVNNENIGNTFNIRYDYNKLKEKIIFWNFLVYKSSCGNKYNYIKFYENLRKKLISVENLIQNNIKINGILKLKDLIHET